jgi:hypothetical protein
MVVAALQHSDLPQYLANVFKGVDALTLTQDQINNALPDRPTPSRASWTS